MHIFLVIAIRKNNGIIKVKKQEEILSLKKKSRKGTQQTNYGILKSDSSKQTTVRQIPKSLQQRRR